MINSHIGTHVDAPLHYVSTCEGNPARTIEAIALDELYCDGPVLDVRAGAKSGEGISVAVLQSALAANGGKLTPGCAIMLRTGQHELVSTHRSLRCNT
jgi:kynurenine formamidase